MNILFPSFRRANSLNAAVRTGQPMRLTRTFVETGDERCPIAGIWSRLIETEQQTDEPELQRLAMGDLFLMAGFWRRFIAA